MADTSKQKAHDIIEQSRKTGGNGKQFALWMCALGSGAVLGWINLPALQFHCNRIHTAVPVHRGADDRTRRHHHAFTAWCKERDGAHLRTCSDIHAAHHALRGTDRARSLPLECPWQSPARSDWPGSRQRSWKAWEAVLL